MPKKYLSFADAIDWTLKKIFSTDKSVILMGLGANDPKNIFGTTKSITKLYPKRVFDMPVSENSMTGIIIGASLNGIKPILVHQRIDFALLSLEQIINQSAKWHYMFDGKMSVPIVIRMIVGRGWGQGPQHSQSLQSLFAHIPGLKVVMPSTSESASNLLYSSIMDPNPIIFIEHRWLHSIKFDFSYKLKRKKIGKANILKKGKDITIVSSSYMTIEVLRLMEYLKQEKIDVELVDLETISPLDKKTIIKSVNKTKRVLVLDTSHKSFGISAEVMAIILENCYDKLISKPIRLANPDVPTPTSFALSKYYYPTKYEVCKCIFKILKIKRKVSNSIRSNDNFLDQPFKEFTGPF